MASDVHQVALGPTGMMGPLPSFAGYDALTRMLAPIQLPQTGRNSRLWAVLLVAEATWTDA